MANKWIRIHEPLYFGAVTLVYQFGKDRYDANVVDDPVNDPPIKSFENPSEARRWADDQISHNCVELRCPEWEPAL